MHRYSQTAAHAASSPTPLHAIEAKSSSFKRPGVQHLPCTHHLILLALCCGKLAIIFDNAAGIQGWHEPMCRKRLATTLIHFRILELVIAITA